MTIHIYITPEGSFYRCNVCSYNMSDSRPHVLSVLATCHNNKVHHSDSTVRMHEVEKVPS